MSDAECPIPKSIAEAALAAGDPKAALQHLTAAVRAKPADAKLRVFLAQLLCVSASGSVRTPSSTSSPTWTPRPVAMRETVGHAIRCELDARQGLRRPAHADGVRRSPTTGWRC